MLSVTQPVQALPVQHALLRVDLAGCATASEKHMSCLLCSWMPHLFNSPWILAFPGQQYLGDGKCFLLVAHIINLHSLASMYMSNPYNEQSIIQ
jgi:hypothetical protein